MNKEVVKKRFLSINAMVIILLFCIFVKVVFYSDSEMDYADDAIIRNNYKNYYSKNSSYFSSGYGGYNKVTYGYISIDNEVNELKYSNKYEKINDVFTFSCDDVIKTKTFTCTLKYEDELLGNIANNYLNLLGFDLSYDDNLQLISAYMEYPNFSLKKYKNRFTIVGNENLINFQNNNIINFEFLVTSSYYDDNFSIELEDIVFSPKTRNMNDLYITDDINVSLELSHLKKYNYEIINVYGSNPDVYFYESENDIYGKINKYSCKNNACKIESILDVDDRILIFDYKFTSSEIDDTSNNRIVLFSYKDGVLKEFDNSNESSFYYMKDNNNNVKYFLGIDKNDGVVKVVDLNGNVVRIIGNGKFINMYSVENDYMVLKVNDKYTLEKISSNLKIKDIYYDELRKMTDNIFIARLNDKLYIVDYTGQNLTDDYIELEMNDFFYSYYNKDNNIINLYIYDESANAGNAKNKLFYQYDIVNNSLVKMEE